MMKSVIKGMAVAAAAMLVAGCAHIGGKTDLAKAAADAKLANGITTGDGNFGKYEAKGFYTGTEIGIAVGLPLTCKFIELYPMQDNTKQMTKIAVDAQKDGANAMINVHPPKETFTGFPFGFIGIYVDSVDGTGINAK